MGGIHFRIFEPIPRSTGNTITVINGENVLADLRKNIFHGRIWPDFARIPYI